MDTQSGRFLYAVEPGIESQEWWWRLSGAPLPGEPESYTRGRPLGTLALRVLMSTPANVAVKMLQDQGAAWVGADPESGPRSEYLTLREIANRSIRGEPFPDSTHARAEVWTADSSGALLLLAVARAIHHQAVYKCRGCRQWVLRGRVHYGRPKYYCSGCGAPTARWKRYASQPNHTDVVRAVNRLTKRSPMQARRARKVATKLTTENSQVGAWLPDFEKRWAPKRAAGRPRKPQVGGAGPTEEDLRTLEHEAQDDLNQAIADLESIDLSTLDQQSGDGSE